MAEKKEISPLYSDIAYDDAFRTMETECDDILIPFVNYVFGEKYDRTAIIKRLRNEHFMESDDSLDRRITDSHFEIVHNGVTKKYHFECESNPYHSSLQVRLFEYDTQIALDNSSLTNNCLHVKLPYTGVLVLRSNENTPDNARIVIETPEGNVGYTVPLIKISDFDIDAIFAKKMYLLIPFYIFCYEKQFNEINGDNEKAEALANVYKDVIERLDKEVLNGNLSLFSHGVIIRLTHSVVYKLTMKHVKIQKKVGDVVGGKVLDLPEVRIYHQGKNEGRAEGQAERDKLINEIQELKKQIEELKKMNQ